MAEAEPRAVECWRPAAGPATLLSFSWAMWKGDTSWRIWTFIGALVAIALYLVRRRYDARREERLRAPAAGERRHGDFASPGRSEPRPCS